jgi:hypothetical protein
MNGWNSDGTIFAVGFRGWLVPFRFDPVAMRATRIPDPSGDPADGGVFLKFNPEGTFSFQRPNIYYGMSGMYVAQFDFNTNQYMNLFDVRRAVPGVSGSMSAVSVSDDDTKFCFALGGGGQQDLWANVVVWNRSNDSWQVLDTHRSTINGSPANIGLGYNVHSAYVERTGRWVVIGVHGAPTDWLVWDTQANRVSFITPFWTGHDVSGFGVRINQDGYFGGPGFYESVAFVKRSLDLASLGQTTQLVAPAMMPLPHSSINGVHMSWNNAQPNAMVPMLASTYRDYRNNANDPWRAWDDEIIAVATDGSSTVWRFAHTRSRWTMGDFWATPRANISQDGRFAMFTSNWEMTLGQEAMSGAPRVDVFVVELSTSQAPAPSPTPSPIPGPSPLPDTVPPSVSITSPGQNQTVSGAISVQASASDNVGVAGVQFQMDGVNLGGEVQAPFTISWNTTQAANGSRRLTAIARDAAGNRTTSAAITVSVSNTTSGGSGGSGSSGFTPIRVNAGGSAYTDSQGNVWMADTGFSAGSSYSSNASIGNTSTPYLYQTERYGSQTYRFTVPDGTYSVTLKFAELFFSGTGRRIFNVALNGQTVLSNFDIVAEAGGSDRAIDKLFTVQAANGQIAIQFTAVIDSPKVNAIEILQIAPAPATGGGGNTGSTGNTGGTGNTSGTGNNPPPGPSTGGFAPIRVNAGGPAYWDSQGNTWSADTGFIGGGAYANTWSSVSGTTTPALYQTERYGASYLFAVPNGTYTVVLKFAELFFGGVGQRIFDVKINGQVVLANFDIIAAAGRDNRAVDRQFTVQVANGQISIQFTDIVEKGKINAIEILQIGTSAPQAPAPSPVPAPAPEPPASTFTPIRVNAGGEAYTDSQGNAWSADTGFTGGLPWADHSATVKQTTNQTVYRSDRYGAMSYSFSVPSGTYSVNLKFAELYFGEADRRAFHVAINGQLVLSNFDIAAEAGGGTAIDKRFTVNASDGQITIHFTPVLDNPTISGIEITRF